MNPSRSLPVAVSPPRATPWARVSRLWAWLHRSDPARPNVPLGELNAHLLRDIDAQGRVHGQTWEHAELARHDRSQAACISSEKWF